MLELLHQANGQHRALRVRRDDDGPVARLVDELLERTLDVAVGEVEGRRAACSRDQLIVMSGVGDGE